ncbi:hypothetical protein JTE90_023166 [Oedothorax gibbosus]|uniref:Uncharacterized protein n=1 Tax=Oedothorax gibbosus TaxID=931172 RepID=A0AAV6USZ6_9ARAC|nr:hypothetical protein JTE90_023166 [Oedothorax gibbosus]
MSTPVSVTNLGLYKPHLDSTKPRSVSKEIARETKTANYKKAEVFEKYNLFDVNCQRNQRRRGTFAANRDISRFPMRHAIVAIILENCCYSFQFSQTLFCSSSTAFIQTNRFFSSIAVTNNKPFHSFPSPTPKPLSSTFFWKTELVGKPSNKHRDSRTPPVRYGVPSAGPIVEGHINSSLPWWKMTKLMARPFLGLPNR